MLGNCCSKSIRAARIILSFSQPEGNCIVSRSSLLSVYSSFLSHVQSPADERQSLGSSESSVRSTTAKGDLLQVQLHLRKVHCGTLTPLTQRYICPC